MRRSRSGPRRSRILEQPRPDHLQPSSFGGEEQRRVNLCLEPGEGAQEFFGNVERVLVEDLARKSIHDTKIFGKTLD